jgi:hypothetical protein
MFTKFDRNKIQINNIIHEFGWHSWYSDWLQTGWPTVQSSSPSREKTFFLSMSSRPVLGPIMPPIQWVLEALSPGVKHLGCEADHSPPTSAEVKNTWIYTSTPLYVFMA